MTAAPSNDAGSCRVLTASPARPWAVLAGFLLLCALSPDLKAALQFDVFVGFGSGGGNDGVVREAAWFPVACEILNDGSSFEGIVEFSSRQVGAGQARRFKLELPTNTRKRFSFPIFAGASRYASWDARLYDARGKLRAERLDLRAKDVSWETFILGGLARGFAGLPILPSIRSNRPELQPQVARITPEQFPDHPIALEGLGALYLNSEPALKLTAPQVNALITWVRGGGHLIVAAEHTQDLVATRWLQELLPARLGELSTNRSAGRVHDWLRRPAEPQAGLATPGASLSSPPLRSRAALPGRPLPASSPSPYLGLAPDAEFEMAEFPVYRASAIEGQTLVGLDATPLAIAASRGRGQVTLLTFNPEREPFKSWKQRAWFWARLLQVAPDLFEAGNPAIYGGYSLDGVVGAMIDTRQVHKLPIEWLLLLLVIYLLVIGPLDYWWLKRINRQMLTWLTFPAYVLLFSLLIYYIGYRLRAGETEWNELHLVDLLPGTEKADLRGRTFASLYSSVNARYRLASDQPYAALRSEFLGPFGGGQESSRVEANLVANGFQAEVGVPVWTSLLYVSDWLETAAAPLSAELAETGGRYRLTVHNLRNQRLPAVSLAFQDKLYEVGELLPGARKTLELQSTVGRSLEQYVRQTAQSFQGAAAARRQAFGRDRQARIELTPENLVATSFITQQGLYQGQQRTFVFPPGLDLTPLLIRGDAVLLAWCPESSPLAESFLKQSPPRRSVNTFYRLVVPVSRVAATGS